MSDNVNAMCRIAPKLIAGILALAVIDAAAIALAPLLFRPKPSDYAIVFGNTVLRDGSPSPRLKARLDTALNLYWQGLVSKVFVSGGFEQENGFDEAEVMANYLQRRGMPAEAIAKDSQGNNSLLTAENAKAVLPAAAKLIVVTQWFHIARASLVMHRAGFANVSAAAPHFVEPRDAYSFLREVVALPVYAVRPMSALGALHPQCSK